MTQQLAAEILTSDSDEIADLKANLPTLEGFINLARDIDALPDTKKRFFEESRSLYQITAMGRNVHTLETLLTQFFGPPVKPCGKPLSRKLRKSSVVKYLGGVQKDQSLFLFNLKTGQFYGALWPWRRNKNKIEIHLGYSSDWMSDDDYEQLETLVQQSISRSTFNKMGADIGGQIHGISLPSFLQMAEMEKSSFTLRITSRNRVGNLHMDSGKLIAAELDGSTGANVAYQIISWDEASIEIKTLDPSKTDEIKQPMMQLLMESLKLKDEAVITRADEDEPKPSDIEGAMPLADKPKPRSQRPAPGRLVRLERAPEPKFKRQKVSVLTLAAIALGAIGIIAAAYMTSLYFANNRKASDGYEKMLAEVDREQSLEQKLSHLQKYLDAYPRSHHTAEIQTKMLEVAGKIEDHEYDQIQLKINALPLDEQYEKKAVAAYEQFLEKYPNSRYAKEILQAITKIKDLIDQYYYEELKQAARLDFTARLKIYRQYLAKFPEGGYGKDVQVLIDEMGKRYLEYLNTEISQCESKQRWEPCVKQFDALIEAYKGLALGQEAAELKAQMVDKRDFFQLRRQVLDAGVDYQKGYQLYAAYLAKNPQSTQKKAVEKEMAELGVHLKVQSQWLVVRQYATNPKNPLIRRLQKTEQYLQKNGASPYARDAQSLLGQLEADRKLSLRQQQALAQKRQEQERLQHEKESNAQQQQRIRQIRAQLEMQLNQSDRFRPRGDGTVYDQSTGLTWALLDSQEELGGCLTYDAAQTYAQGLGHGGKRDWRLPTASELASIYKKQPFYPSSGGKWYWSSETYTKGYHNVGVVVTDKPETVFEPEQRTLSECGTARPVRSTQP
jgi:cell division protein FtsL